MPQTKKYFIFDLDGTLYKYDKELSSSFEKSQFRQDLRNRAISFLSQIANLDIFDAKNEYEKLKLEFSGDFSLAMETKYDIPKKESISFIWKISPNRYVKPNPQLVTELGKLKGRIALVTGSPNAWAIPTLRHLKIDKFFDPAIYTYDYYLKKPDPSIFAHVADKFKTDPSNIISIGDNFDSDLAPAKRIGMKTMLISDSKQLTDADMQATNILEAIQALNLIST